MDLFIIRTPFQAFLTEKIIDKKRIKNIVVVYISPSNNDSQKYAYERIKILSKTSYYIYLGENKNKISNLFRHVYAFVYLQVIKKYERFNNIYVSSINSVPVQLLISYINFNNLYTFDDGSANYYYDSEYYNDVEAGFILRTTAKFFGNKYSKKILLQKSKGHFAILPNERNINSVIIYLDIKLNIQKNIEHCKYESCNVLIGSIYSIISNNPEQLVNDIKNKMDIDYYIPHPRLNKSDFLKNKLLIQNNSIAELQIENLLREYKYVNVYAFNSTVLLSLKNIERLTLFLIGHDSLKQTTLGSKLKLIINNNFNLSDN